MRNHLKRGGGEVAALDMINTDIFSGNPPRDLYKYFRNRRRHFAFNPYYLQQKCALSSDAPHVTLTCTLGPRIATMLPYQAPLRALRGCARSSRH